jgi:flagellar assembly protein FliH
LSWQVKARRISLSKASNTKGTITEAGAIWPNFDIESPQSPSVSKKEEEADFVSFRNEGKEIPEFTPLEEPGGEQSIRKRAEEILKEAESKTAFLEREAYEKGFAQGEKDGRELGQKKIVKSIENIENLFMEFGNLKTEILKQFEKEVLDLVFSIAEKIIHKKIDEDDKIIKKAVIEAMHAVTEKSQIVIKVNPDDFDTIENMKPDFFKTFKDLKSIVVNPDLSVSRGGCLLETPYGDIDASVEARLDKIHQSLNRAFLVKGDE